MTVIQILSVSSLRDSSARSNSPDTEEFQKGKPLIIPRKTASQVRNGITKSLVVVEHPNGWTTERILWTVTPIRLPGWSVIYQSTHTRELTLRHLLLKFLLMEINKNEAEVLTMLVVALPPSQYEIFLLILSNQTKIQMLRKEMEQWLRDYNFLGIEDPKREFKSFCPELFIFKMWTLAAKLPPKQYIGIGYNDHGHLATAPSWKDQLTDDGEVTPELSAMRLSLEKIFGLPLFRNSPSRGFVRLTSSRERNRKEV